MALGKDPLVITVDGLDIVLEETQTPTERVKVRFFADFLTKKCDTIVVLTLKCAVCGRMHAEGAGEEQEKEARQGQQIQTERHS
jgi:hypothetical protein